MPLVRRIVVGTDFSRGSNRAVLYAAELAKAVDASLTVLHVDEKAAFVPGSDLAEREGRADRAQMDALVRQLAGRHVAARGVVRPGIPPEGLCDYARGEQADLLVIGAEDRTCLGNLALGSVAERVLRDAPCPVLVARTR